MTSEELCSILFKIEKKYNLLDLDISGVKIWQSLRMELYYLIAVEANIEEQAHTKLTKLDKLKRVSGYIKNSLLNNPFVNKTTDVIVFSHPRPKRVNGKTIDIYTKYFIDELVSKEKSFLELETAYLGTHTKDMTKNKSYTDFIVLMTKLFKKFIKVKFDEKEKSLIDNINKEFSDIFGIKIDITNEIIDGIKTFKVKKYFYNKLFLKLKPKQLYICPSYGNSDVVSAAKDLNIEVIEIQHGVFSDYHLGYSFPNREKELDYFPNKFLVWGEYWKDLIKFPIPSENVQVRQFDFLEKNIKKYSSLEKKEQLVVLSQGNVGNQMANLLLSYIDKFKDLKIIYKLHPGEFDRYKKYEALQKLLDVYKNIEIVKEIDLHKLLAESKYQIGINSTALFEGVEFGCETILFNTSGIEYMTKFINFYQLTEDDKLFLSEETKKKLNL